MPTAKARLAEEYDELFQLYGFSLFPNLLLSSNPDIARSFGGGSELSVRLFRREEDHRSRILCKIPSSRGSSYCCLPLNNLEIVRSESCLQVCRKTRTKDELDLWANLRFSTFESMLSIALKTKQVTKQPTQGWCCFSVPLLRFEHTTVGVQFQTSETMN